MLHARILRHSDLLLLRDQIVPLVDLSSDVTEEGENDVWKSVLEFDSFEVLTIAIFLICLLPALLLRVCCRVILFEALVDVLKLLVGHDLVLLEELLLELLEVDMGELLWQSAVLLARQARLEVLLTEVSIRHQKLILTIIEDE